MAMAQPRSKSRKQSNMFTFETVCVVGLGYIGLPTAAVLANSGPKVIGVDVNSHAVDTINQGKAHIIEVDLDGLLQGVVARGDLKAQSSPENADVFIIAVPTPFKDSKVPDLAYVESAVRSVAPFVQEGNLLILESTVPPGATEKMVKWLEEERPDLKQAGGVGHSFFAAHCPERVLPGRVLVELVQNDRIIGGVTQQCALRAKALYELFVRSECYLTDARTAELAKLTENAFRDVNIAFANELSLICDDLDINVWELIKLANKHPRVNILQPGPGVGGHCIAVDPWFIADASPGNARLIKTARNINDDKPSKVVSQVTASLSGITHPKVAFFGLAFKADIDDLRESPAVEIVTEVAKVPNIEVFAVEPNIDELPSSLAALGVQLVEVQEAIGIADVCVLLVDHKSFKQIDPQDLEAKQLIDTRGVWV